MINYLEKFGIILSAFVVAMLLFYPVAVVAQDTIPMDEVYIENDLVYKYSDDDRFTGVAYKKRKNGHLVCEQIYKDGVILSSNEYYNGKKKLMCHQFIYYRYKPWIIQKEYYYPKSRAWSQITSFDESGRKILLEQFEGEKLTYSCQYNGKKKHGIEYCISEEGEELTFEYVNGKKKK